MFPDECEKALASKPLVEVAAPPGRASNFSGAEKSVGAAVTAATRAASSGVRGITRRCSSAPAPATAAAGRRASARISRRMAARRFCAGRPSTSHCSRNGGAPDFGRRRNPAASAPRRADACRVRGAATAGFGSGRGCVAPLRLRARALRRTARPRQCLGFSGRRALGGPGVHPRCIGTALPGATPHSSRNGRAPDFGRRRNPAASAPEGGRIRVRGAATCRIWSRTGLPHPPSPPRWRAPANGPAEAMPRLLGPGLAGRGPLRSRGAGPAGRGRRSREAITPTRAYWKTASGLSRLSEPSKAMAFEAERRDGALDRAGLGDQPVHRPHHQCLAGGVAGGEHLVVVGARLGGDLDLEELQDRAVERRPEVGVDRRVGGGDEGGDRRPLDDAAVGAHVAAVVDVADAEPVVEVAVVGVVGEAVVLLLGVVEHEAEAHALAGLLAVGEAAHAGEERDQPGVGIVGDGRAGLAAVGPLGGDPLEVGDEEVGRGGEVGAAAVAVAAGAGVAGGVVGPRALAGAGLGAVEVLAPEQELDGVIAGGDVGLDGVGLLEGVLEEGGRDLGRVDLAGREGDLRVGDDVERGVGVLVGGAAVALVDVVDQALVEGPGVHLALPRVDDGVAEAEDLGLLVGHARLEPAGAGGLEGLGRGLGDQRVDRRGEALGGGERIAVAGLGDVGVIGDHGGLVLRPAPGRNQGDGARGEQIPQSHSKIPL